jgi:hypothetical protein
MGETGPRELGLLAKVVIAVAIALFVAGLLWRDISVENIERMWRNLIGRPSEAMAFRFILQPSMAALAAIKDGLADARTGRPPFLLTILSRPDERMGGLREALNATARIVLLGMAMDVIYQFVVLKEFYPLEAVIIAILLAFAPYVLLRGLISRAAGKWGRGGRSRKA